MADALAFNRPSHRHRVGGEATGMADTLAVNRPSTDTALVEWATGTRTADTLRDTPNFLHAIGKPKSRKRPITTTPFCPAATVKS